VLEGADLHEQIRTMIDEVKAAGQEGLHAYSRARPAFQERLAIAEATLLADQTQCPVNLLHLSSAEALEGGRKARRDYPGINVIVHPECELEVVQAADFAGSTEFILSRIAGAAPGSQWAVGTEASMVHRLAAENPDKLIFCLDPIVCPCSTMYRIHPAYIAWVLDNLLEGRVVNRIQVEPETKRWAKVALERMLALP